MLRQGLIVAAAALTASVATAQTPGGQVIGVPRAVQVAEATVKGRALKAELDYEKGRLVYEVKTAAKGRVQEVVIDAMSGEIVAQHPKRMDSAWRWLAQPDQLNAVHAASTPLSQLLTRVESERGARVSEVSLERERGQTFYEVELADGGRDVLIDPRTGAMRPGNFDD
jgi:uncharacterized membrane protein YkoI